MKRHIQFTHGLKTNGVLIRVQGWAGPHYRFQSAEHFVPYRMRRSRFLAEVRAALRQCSAEIK